MKLTPQQHDAVHRIGQDVCVIAGPGSGKTRVLAERFSWLVADQGISPRNILALTFTDKAASEIRDRVGKTLRERTSQLTAEIELAPISTFHSLCTRILKEFAIAAGIDPATELWDERIASAELHACAESVLNAAAHNEKAALRSLFTTWNTANLVPDLCGLYQKILSLSDDFPGPGQTLNLPGLLADFTALGEDLYGAKATTPISQSFHEKFCEHFSQFRQLGFDPRWDHIAAIGSFPKRGNLPKGIKEPARLFYDYFPQISSLLVSALVSPQRNYLIEILHRIATNFEQRKIAAARMDFHDLEHRSIRLLRNNPGVREELQRRFEHILMDEMQDTNPVQWTLLDLIRTPGTFFAVGDVNQSIYGFRFAAPAEFIAYRNSILQTGGEVDFLGDNFRSRAEILSFTQTVSNGLAGIEPPQLRAGRNFATQNAAVSLHAFEQHEDEFRWIAQEILNLSEHFIVEPKDGGALRRLLLSDIAILCRTSNKAEAIAATLAGHNIAYTLGGGRKFFDTQEVADLICYLEVLANPTNTIALAAVLRSPLVGLSDDQLLDNYVNRKFTARLEAQRKRLDGVSPDRFLVEVLDASGYTNTLNSGARANVEKFLRIVREQWQIGPGNIRVFVDEMQSMRQAAQEKSAPVADSGAAVQILTVHSSKGLEFPVVFVAGAYFSTPANRATLSFAPPNRVGVRWTNPVNGKTLPDHEASRIDTEQKEEEEKELQRQLYVALTRAEQKLYVSWAGKQKRGWLKYLEAHKDLYYPEGGDLPALETAADHFSDSSPLQLLPLARQPLILSSSNPGDIAKYANCPRRFFLDRLANLQALPTATPALDFADPDEELPTPNAADLGTVVHQILGQQTVEHDFPEARTLAQVFLDSPLAGRANAANWVEREFDFVFSLEDLVLQGQIDLCFEEANGEITIIDYKTDQVPSNRYDMQLALYREAIARLYPGQKIRSYLYFLRTNQVIEATLPIDLKLIRRFRSGEDFSTREGPQCERCPHLAKACPVIWPLALLSLS